jgi:hypothetical protein
MSVFTWSEVPGLLLGIVRLSFKTFQFIIEIDNVECLLIA